MSFITASAIQYVTFSTIPKNFPTYTDEIDRMIKRSSHGCFHFGPISRSRSSSALGYRLGLIIDARPWYAGLYENSRVITSKYNIGLMGFLWLHTSCHMKKKTNVSCSMASLLNRISPETSFVLMGFLTFGSCAILTVVQCVMNNSRCGFNFKDGGNDTLCSASWPAGLTPISASSLG